MADRYDDDRWFSRGPAGWDDNRDRADRGRDRAERGPMARGADEVRSWFGDDEAQRRREHDERREQMENRARSSYDAPYGWEGGGRTARRPSYDSYERDVANRLPVDRNSDPAAGSDRSRGYTGHRGYFDSSMGYPDDQANTGSLNPFTYRGPSGASSHGPSGAPYRDSSSGSPGTSFSGRGPKNYQRSDERIREDIIDRLTDDHRVDASDIDVQVRNGEVTLSGQVHDRRMRRAAEECIEELAGVRDVHNNLQLTGGHRGALGQAGAPQERDDVTSLNLTGAQAQAHRDDAHPASKKS